MASTLIAPPKRRRRKKHARRNHNTPAVERTVAPQEVYDWFNPAQLNWKNIDWVTLVWMVGIHAGCLAAPFFFTWKAIGVALVATGSRPVSACAWAITATCRTSR